MIDKKQIDEVYNNLVDSQRRLDDVRNDVDQNQRELDEQKEEFKKLVLTGLGWIFLDEETLKKYQEL